LIASNCIYSHEQSSFSDDEIIRRTRTEIAEFAPLAAVGRIRHARVHRVPMAIICPRPGTETARPHTKSNVDGLLIAGDWTNTGLPSCMESATYSGRLAAEQIVGAPDFTRAIPPPDGDAVIKFVRHLWPAYADIPVDAQQPRVRELIGTRATHRRCS
jgi:15-cis-phytoene desaturase